MRLFALTLLVCPLVASAQTLRIEVEASAPVVSQLVQPRVVIATPDPAAPPRAVVVVPPLSEDHVIEPGPVRVVGPTERPVQVVAPSASNAPPHHDDLEHWIGLNGFVDILSLDTMPLAMGNPEIAALQGARLDERWAGMHALHSAVLGGGAIRIEQRALGFLRGPVFTFSLGGGDVTGPYGHLPGSPDELSVAPRTLTVLRAELAFGVQVPIFETVIPYLLLRGSAGAYWLGVEVAHSSLGTLGGETLDNAIFELGMELGVDLRLAPNLELQCGGRFNFAGPSTISFVLGLSTGGA